MLQVVFRVRAERVDQDIDVRQFQGSPALDLVQQIGGVIQINAWHHAPLSGNRRIKRTECRGAWTIPERGEHGFTDDFAQGFSLALGPSAAEGKRILVEV